MQRGDTRKGCRRVNMVDYYALMYENRNMTPVETVPGVGGGARTYCEDFCK
jgi:hypothetical protein